MEGSYCGLLLLFFPKSKYGCRAMANTGRFYNNSLSDIFFYTMLSRTFLGHRFVLTTRDFEERMQPLFQLGEISEEELKQYDSKNMTMYHISHIRSLGDCSFMEFQKKRKIEVVAIENGDSLVRRCEDLDINILVMILSSFDLFQLIYAISQVCRAWRLACCDPRLWKTLDLSLLQSNFIRLPLKPYVYVDSPSKEKLTRVLNICLNLSRGNIQTLIFHPNLYVNDNQLTFTAERCPQLKRLDMPSWNKIKKRTMCKAIHIWKDLESLTMPRINNPARVIEEIGRSCQKFSMLKVVGPCDMFFASALASILPNLEVLSLRCMVLSKPALSLILEELKKLKVLNISHCIITEDPPLEPMRILIELDESILKKASRLDKFLTCMSDSCIMCQRPLNDQGFMRWYKYEEDLWKVDEVKSLAV